MQNAQELANAAPELSLNSAIRVAELFGGTLWVGSQNIEVVGSHAGDPDEVDVSDKYPIGFQRKDEEDDDEA